jgi:hypothetical protein
MNLTDWIERYGRAWESADEELIVSLFTEDAQYRSSPSASRTSATLRSAPGGAAGPATSGRRMCGWGVRSWTAIGSPSSGGRR